MNLSGIKREVGVSLAVIRANFSNEAELRSAFILQIFGMILNNFAFVIIWIFFFKTFGPINNWSTSETIGLQGFVALIFGFCFSFGGGVRTLARKVYDGSFDNVLLTPRSLYLRIVTGGMDTSALGDVVFGLILLGAYIFMAHLSFLQIFLLLSLTVPAVIIFMNLTLLSSLISFVIPDAEQLSRSLFELFFGPSMYPAALYQGVMRFIFFIGIPSLAIGGVPVEAVRDISLSGYVSIWVLAGVWTLIANWTLGAMVKRYESGNLVGSRE